MNKQQFVEADDQTPQLMGSTNRPVKFVWLRLVINDTNSTSFIINVIHIGFVKF